MLFINNLLVYHHTWVCVDIRKIGKNSNETRWFARHCTSFWASFWVSIEFSDAPMSISRAVAAGVKASTWGFYSWRNGYMEKCVLALALSGYSHVCTSTNELLSRWDHYLASFPAPPCRWALYRVLPGGNITAALGF